MLKVRFVIDIAMAIAWLLTLKYKLLWAGHEYVGVLLFALFILHIILNYRWFANLGKGTYNNARKLRTFINFALLISMIAVILTAPFIARAADTGFNTGLTRASYKLFKGIHKGAGKLGFALMVVHMFMHMAFFKNILRIGKAK